MKESHIKCLLSTGLFAWMGLYLWLPIRATDVWWHLASGRWMWNHGLLPLADPFSWTCRGHDWTNFEWLYQLVLYGSYQLLGPSGLIILKGVLILSAFGVMNQHLAFRECPWPLRFLFLVVAFWTCRYGWTERVDHVSLLGLALLLYGMDRYGNSTLHGWSATAWGCLLFLIWANMHPGFPVGLAVVGFLCAGWILEGKGRIFDHLSRCALFAGMTAINPFGLRLHHIILHEASMVHHGVSLSEYMPTFFKSLETFWLTLAFGILLIGRRLIGMPRRGIGPALITAFLGYMAVSHIRFVPLFMIAIFPIMWETLDESHKAFEIKLSRLRAIHWAYALFLLLIITPRVLVARQIQVLQHVPEEACQFIARHRITGPFFHDYEWGGYWAWRFNGEPGDFFDGRSHTVEGFESLMKEVDMARQGSPDKWGLFLAKKGVKAAMVKYPGPSAFSSVFRLYFPIKTWALVYWDDKVLIFIQRSAGLQKWLQDEEFREVTPDLPVEIFRKEYDLSSPAKRGGMLRELKRNLALHPHSQRTYEFLRVLSAG